MNSYYTILIIFLTTCFSDSLFAQKPGNTDAVFNEWKEYFDQSYGADLELVNGIKYGSLVSVSGGHPFLEENRFYSGYVVINGRQYADIEIKYDICMQRIVLNYSFIPGEEEQIVLNNEFIDAFELDSKLFRKYSFQETGTKFLQVIESSELCCLYFWKKRFNKTSASGTNVSSFSSSKKKAYLLISEKIMPFKTKRSFVKLFPEEHQKLINQFIRTNKIWSNKVPDNKMQNLINFCDKLEWKRE